MNQITSMAADLALREAFEAQLPDQHQRNSFAKFVETGLPHPRAENWRWTDLHGAIGKTLAKQTIASNCQSLVSIADLTGDEIAKDELFSDPLAQLAHAVSAPGSRRSFRIDQSPKQVIKLTTQSEQALAGSHVQIRIASGCEAVLLESNQQLAQSVSINLRQIIVDPGASLTRIVVNEAAPEQTRINQTLVQVEDKGSYQQFIVDFGARLSRHESHVSLVGQDTHIGLNGAYLLDSDLRADMTSVVRHEQRSGKTRQLVKGVVLANAEAVFQGKFYVAPKGQLTDAVMGHHCLLLSDKARVRAKPELEIYADDVACAHGNTIGSLDVDALFYMRQRGLEIEAAKALLVRAFVVEAMQDIPDQQIFDQISDQIDQWLERNL